MELERLVGVFALSLVVAGWLSLLTCKLSRGPRGSTIGQWLLFACLFGLGSVTLIAGLLQIGCALTTGLTSTILLLIIIVPTGTDACDETVRRNVG